MTQRKMPHRIRLRKPWQRYDHPARLDDAKDAIGATADVASTAASVIGVDVPDRSPSDFSGPPADANRVHRVTYCRKFHRPSGIGPDDQVHLAVGAVVGRIAEIRINAVAVSGQQVPNESQRTVDTTVRLSLDGRLANHNELEIDLESTAVAPGLPRLVGDVKLWITPSSP